jgi:hypothetical protein
MSIIIYDSQAYPGIISLKTAKRDRSPSLTMVSSLSLDNCTISFRNLILDSGSVSKAFPNSASLHFLLSKSSSTLRSSLTSA